MRRDPVEDRTFASQAATALKLTSKDLLKAELVDEIIPEPLGGAHTDHKSMAATLKQSLLAHLRELKTVPTDTLLRQRYDKFRAMGVFNTEPVNNTTNQQASPPA